MSTLINLNDDFNVVECPECGHINQCKLEDDKIECTECGEPVFVELVEC